MTKDELRKVVDVCVQAAEAGDDAAVWPRMAPLLEGWRGDLETARFLAVALTSFRGSTQRRLELASELVAAYAHDRVLLSILGGSAEWLVDIRYLNAAAPNHPFFTQLLAELAREFDASSDAAARIEAGEALAGLARLVGRGADALCERIHLELLKLRPGRWENEYNYGLFLKTRGRFAEGTKANQRASTSGGSEDESVFWNMGICATGAGDGAHALKIWTERMNAKLTLGEDGLPTGTWHAVKVRLAQHPLAERTAGQDAPGEEETVWVERLSPCHGRLVSAPCFEVGLEYGDLVLFDGAPITSHEVNGRKVPVFPHLATLRRCGWRVFPFVATQQRSGQIAEISSQLPGDTVLYVHTEQVRVLCEKCWANGADSHHHDHGDERTTTKTVRGKFCVDPTQDLAVVDRALSAFLKGQPELRVVSPDLARALGDPQRAKREEREFEVLATT